MILQVYNQLLLSGNFLIKGLGTNQPFGDQYGYIDLLTKNIVKTYLDNTSQDKMTYMYPLYEILF